MVRTRNGLPVPGIFAACLDLVIAAGLGLASLLRRGARDPLEAEPGPAWTIQNEVPDHLRPVGPGAQESRNLKG